MDKATIFRIINQLDYEFVTCTDCKELLRGHIYTLDKKYFCENCLQLRPKTRNETLEQILKKMIYPCAYNECDFRGLLTEIEKHMEVCYFHGFECRICKKGINESVTIQHLREEHQDILVEQVLEDPEVTLPFVTDSPIKVYLLTLHMHTFVVLTISEMDNLMISIGKTQQLETNVIDKFQLKYERDCFELTMKGVVSNIRQILGNSLDASKTRPIQVCTSDGIETYTIYFNDFNLLKDLVDICPICLHSISSTFYQCVNNHSVCVSCRPKMRTCPTCRGRMQDILVDLRFTMSKVPYNCSNSSLGCIQYISSENIKDHLKECPFQSVNCEECKLSIAKCNIVSHMGTHSGVIKNFECTDILGVEEAYKGKARYTYTICDNNVFKFTLSLIKTMPRRLCFNVQLLYCSVEATAQEYRYVAQLLANEEDLLGQFCLENYCQTYGDNDQSSSIPFTILQPYLNDNIVKFRFYVYKHQQLLQQS